MMKGCVEDYLLHKMNGYVDEGHQLDCFKSRNHMGLSSPSDKSSPSRYICYCRLVLHLLDRQERYCPGFRYICRFLCRDKNRWMTKPTYHVICCFMNDIYHLHFQQPQELFHFVHSVNKRQLDNLQLQLYKT